MAKQMFTLRDFSGGINTTKDPRDISLNEQVYLKDFYVDQNGALRPSGSLISHDGLVDNKDLPAGNIISVIQGSAGYNLAYFETDHDNVEAAKSTGAVSMVAIPAIITGSYTDPVQEPEIVT